MSILFLIFGLGLFFAILLLGKQLTRADAKLLATRLRKFGGIAALFGAGFLFVTGRLAPAIFLATFALALLGRNMSFPFGWPTGGQRTRGQASSVRTPYLEMALDHDTGQMAGRVLRGQFEGRLLSDLSPADLGLLMEELRTADEQGAQLLDAYLERASGGTGASASTGAARDRQQRAGGETGARWTMSVDEAYRILNLKPGATRDEIQAAHRNLMKRVHPDQGGSTYLASKINEAKAILLERVQG